MADPNESGFLHSDPVLAKVYEVAASVRECRAEVKGIALAMARVDGTLPKDMRDRLKGAEVRIEGLEAEVLSLRSVAMDLKTDMAKRPTSRVPRQDGAGVDTDRKIRLERTKQISMLIGLLTAIVMALIAMVK